jgi:hypothetical protein
VYAQTRQRYADRELVLARRLAVARQARVLADDKRRAAELIAGIHDGVGVEDAASGVAVEFGQLSLGRVDVEQVSGGLDCQDGSEGKEATLTHNDALVQDVEEAVSEPKITAVNVYLSPKARRYNASNYTPDSSKEMPILTILPRQRVVNTKARKYGQKLNV